MLPLTATRKIANKNGYGALLGSGISHSLSPVIHNFSAQYLNLDCSYLSFDCIPKKFPKMEFFDFFWDIGAYGFNVTMPFKGDAARLFPQSKLNSVNTIFRGLTSWEATSTDADGFLLGLEKLSCADFAAIILLGNGGAAQALYEHFLDTTSKPMRVLRRNSERDKSWKRLPGRAEFFELSAAALQQVVEEEPNSLLIQSTSGPMQGENLEFLVSGLRDLQGPLVDLVYGTPSALLKAAQHLGLPIQDGLPMLIGQAILAQELWWKKSVPYIEVEQHLRQYLKQN